MSLKVTLADGSCQIPISYGVGAGDDSWFPERGGRVARRNFDDALRSKFLGEIPSESDFNRRLLSLYDVLSHLTAILPPLATGVERRPPVAREIRRMVRVLGEGVALIAALPAHVRDDVFPANRELNLKAVLESLKNLLLLCSRASLPRYLDQQRPRSLAPHAPGMVSLDQKPVGGVSATVIILRAVDDAATTLDWCDGLTNFRGWVNRLDGTRDRASLILQLGFLLWGHMTADARSGLWGVFHKRFRAAAWKAILTDSGGSRRRCADAENAVSNLLLQTWSGATESSIGTTLRERYRMPTRPDGFLRYVLRTLKQGAHSQFVFSSNPLESCDAREFTIAQVHFMMSPHISKPTLRGWARKYPSELGVSANAKIVTLNYEKVRTFWQAWELKRRAQRSLRASEVAERTARERVRKLLAEGVEPAELARRCGVSDEEIAAVRSVGLLSDGPTLDESQELQRSDLSNEDGLEWDSGEESVAPDDSDPFEDEDEAVTE